MPGASVTDFDDWVVFAEIPDDASRGESCGEDVLNLSVPCHATDVFQGLLLGSRRHGRGWLGSLSGHYPNFFSQCTFKQRASSNQ